MWDLSRLKCWWNASFGWAGKMQSAKFQQEQREFMSLWLTKYLWLVLTASKNIYSIHMASKKI